MHDPRQFDLVEAAEADDLKVERDGAALLVDEVSLPLLTGGQFLLADRLIVGDQVEVKITEGIVQLIVERDPVQLSTQALQAAIREVPRGAL